MSYLEVRLDCVRASSSPHLSAGGLSHARNLVNLDAIDALSRNPLHEEVAGGAEVRGGGQVIATGVGIRPKTLLAAS